MASLFHVYTHTLVYIFLVTSFLFLVKTQEITYSGNCAGPLSTSKSYFGELFWASFYFCGCRISAIKFFSHITRSCENELNFLQLNLPSLQIFFIRFNDCTLLFIPHCSYVTGKIDSRFEYYYQIFVDHMCPPLYTRL